MCNFAKNGNEVFVGNSLLSTTEVSPVKLVCCVLSCCILFLFWSICSPCALKQRMLISSWSSRFTKKKRQQRACVLSTHKKKSWSQTQLRLQRLRRDGPISVRFLFVLQENICKVIIHPVCPSLVIAHTTLVGWIPHRPAFCRCWCIMYWDM